MSKTPKVLVTGGSGQLGQAFRKLINQNGTEEYFYIRTRADLDITKSIEIETFCVKNEIQYIINCAAYTNVDKAETEKAKCYEVNVAAVQQLAKICDKRGIALIHISSDYVYHPSHNLTSLEEDFCTPVGVYAKSKWEGEEALRSVLSRYIIVRTSWVYGEHGHNFVKTMLKLGESKSELNIVDDQIGSPTYTSDLADAILSIIEVLENQDVNKEIWGTYNYSNAGFISWADFANEIFIMQSIPTKINRIPSSEYPTPAKRPLNSRLSKSKITDTFQLELSHWKKSLNKCLKEIDNSMGI